MKFTYPLGKGDDLLNRKLDGPKVSPGPSDWDSGYAYPFKFTIFLENPETDREKKAKYGLNQNLLKSIRKATYKDGADFKIRPPKDTGSPP